MPFVFYVFMFILDKFRHMKLLSSIWNKDYWLGQKMVFSYLYRFFCRYLSKSSFEFVLTGIIFF